MKERRTMKRGQKVKQMLILLLLIDAAAVFVMQVMKLNPWPFVCLYWAILTVKNALDWRE